MRSKEAFTYSRSIGYFCSVCSGNRPSKRIIQASRPVYACGRDLSPCGLAGRDGDQLTNAVACAWFGTLTRCAIFVLSFDSMIRSHLAQAKRYIAEMKAVPADRQRVKGQRKAPVSQ